MAAHGCHFVVCFWCLLLINIEIFFLTVRDWSIARIVLYKVSIAIVSRSFLEKYLALSILSLRLRVAYNKQNRLTPPDKAVFSNTTARVPIGSDPVRSAINVVLPRTETYERRFRNPSGNEGMQSKLLSTYFDPQTREFCASIPAIVRRSGITRKLFKSASFTLWREADNR